MGVVFQIICGLILCDLSISMGLIFAWPSSTVTLLRSENTTLYRPMTNGEIALLGSLTSAGAMVGTPIFAVLLNRLGRRNSAILCSLLNLIGWVVISSFEYVEAVLTGVFIAGLGSSGFLIISVFICEFTQESIRGALSSFSMVLYAFGTLLSYMIGGLLNYWHCAYTCLAVVALNTCLIFILKESPMFLLMKGFEKDAAESLAFYRRLPPTSKEVFDELNKLRRALNADSDDDLSPEEEKFNPDKKKKEKLNIWQFFKQSKTTRRAMFINLILMTASIFQGMVVVQVYAQPMFEATVPEMSATLASAIFATIGVVIGFVAAYFSEKAGRKPLIIYPSIGAGICCVLCGLQIHLHIGPNWMVPLYIFVYSVFFALGGATVPIILTSELFLPEVKSFMAMVVVEWTWTCNFLILIIFEPISNAIGLGPVFYLFAVVCFLTAVFSIFFVPETKGLPLDEVQKLLKPKKRRPRV